jgi:hypothetical protein
MQAEVSRTRMVLRSFGHCEVLVDGWGIDFSAAIFEGLVGVRRAVVVAIFFSKFGFLQWKRRCLPELQVGVFETVRTRRCNRRGPIYGQLQVGMDTLAIV